MESNKRRHTTSVIRTLQNSNLNTLYLEVDWTDVVDLPPDNDFHAFDISVCNVTLTMPPSSGSSYFIHLHLPHSIYAPKCLVSIFTRYTDRRGSQI